MRQTVPLAQLVAIEEEVRERVARALDHGDEPHVLLLHDPERLLCAQERAREARVRSHHRKETR